MNFSKNVCIFNLNLNIKKLLLTSLKTDLTVIKNLPRLVRIPLEESDCDRSTNVQLVDIKCATFNLVFNNCIYVKISGNSKELNFKYVRDTLKILNM